MKRLIALYIVFLLLMLGWQHISTNKQAVSKSDKISIFQKFHDRIRRSLSNDQKKYFNLTIAFVVGDEKKGLARIKSSYKSLGLLHLFTPSGFHLQALLMCFGFLGLKKFRKKFLYSCLLLFFIPGFEALKRVVVLKIAESSHHKLKNLIPNGFYLFNLIFLLFFIAGDYSKSPLSFSLSYLFLGTIYALKENPKLSTIHYFFSFFFAQILVQIFLPQEITIEHFLVGFFLGLAFNLLFPVMIICYLLLYLHIYFSKKFITILLLPTKFFHTSCVYFSNVQFSITNFHGAFVLTILVLLAFRHFLPRFLTKFALIICLTIFSAGIKKEKKINKRDLAILQGSLKEAATSPLNSL